MRDLKPVSNSTGSDVSDPGNTIHSTEPKITVQISTEDLMVLAEVMWGYGGFSHNPKKTPDLANPTASFDRSETGHIANDFRDQADLASNTGERSSCLILDKKLCALVKEAALSCLTKRQSAEPDKDPLIILSKKLYFGVKGSEADQLIELDKPPTS